MEQVKPFILSHVSVSEKFTIYLSSSFYNLPHIGASILSPVTYAFSDHLTTTMVDISPYVYFLFIFPPYVAEPSVCLEYCFSYSEKTP